ncbi:MAG: zinc-dependent alcohol dehydrogenase [Christensenellales bacterium]|jgi:L-iditol 2-dehydrogenase
MEGMMRALVKTARGAGNIQLREVPIPKTGPDDVLMKVWGSAICGTDIHIYRDEYTAYEPGLILGHEFSADVVGIGENVKNVQVGDRVISDVSTPQGTLGNDRVNGSHAEYLVMPYNQVHKLPDALSYKDGVLMEVFVACQHGLLERMHIRPGDFALIIGSGPVGIIMLQAMKMFTPRGVMITSLREDKIRMDMAKRYEPDYAMYADEDILGKVMELTNGKGADVVIECSGSDEGIRLALQAVKKGGQVNAFAVFNNDMVSADLSLIPLKCLTVVGSWSWIGYTEEATRTTGGAVSYQRAIDIAANSKLDLAGLITHEFPLEAFEEAFAVCQEKRGVAVMFKP